MSAEDRDRYKAEVERVNRATDAEIEKAEIQRRALRIRQECERHVPERNLPVATYDT